MEKSRLLMKSKPKVFDTDLAVLIGLNEALVLQQIEYWCNIKEEADRKKEQTREVGFIDGHYWTYNTIEEWHEEFPFWSYDTVKRTLKKLRDKNIILVGNFNKAKFDRTLWYTVNHEELIKLEKNQKENSISAKCTNEENSHLEKENPSKTLKTHISAKCPNHKMQNALMDKSKKPQPIPKNTTKTSTKISTSSSSVEIESDNLIDYFNENICELKKTTRVKFEKFIKNKSIEFVKALIDYQAEINTKSYAGFAKAIDNFKDLETVEELNAAIEKFRVSKKQKSEFANRTKKSNKNKVTTFEETKDQQLKSYNDAVEDDFNNLTL